MKVLSEISLKQARSDLQYLRETYGDISDYCGSFCQCDKLEGILNGTTTVKKVIIEYIGYYFSNGVDITNIINRTIDSDSFYIMPDKNDKRVQKIIERYSITPTCDRYVSKDGDIFSL